MNNPFPSKILWDNAARDGLVLGLFTAACRLLIDRMTIAEGSAGMAILCCIVWAVKFGGCLWFMKYCMEKFSRRYSDAGTADTARYGRRTALLSAFVFSAMLLCYMLVIDPASTEARTGMMMEMFSQMYGTGIDTNTMNALRQTMDMYPQVTFVSTLAYSYLYGVILSSILARHIAANDPFAEFMNKND